MSFAMTLPIGSYLRVDLDISILGSKPLIVWHKCHLVRQNENLQPFHIRLIRHNHAHQTYIALAQAR